MKGDYIEVVTAVGSTTQTTRITATKAGRTVTAKYGTKWLEVHEAARPTSANPRGRPTGNSIKVRIDAIVSVEERHTDEFEPPRWRLNTGRAETTETNNAILLPLVHEGAP